MVLADCPADLTNHQPAPLSRYRAGGGFGGIRQPRSERDYTMSKYDSYGGASYDPMFDMDEPQEWNPIDDIDEPMWALSATSLDGDNQWTVEVHEVAIPDHDKDGMATDCTIPQEHIGQKTLFVVRSSYDWGHDCGDGVTEVCPKGTTARKARMGAANLMDPAYDNDVVVLDDISHWIRTGNHRSCFKGNPELELLEDPHAIVLCYGDYQSEPIGYDGSSLDGLRAVYDYIGRMGWDKKPPKG